MMDMALLPDCADRGERLSPTESFCASEQVVHIGAVNADICRACEFRTGESTGLGDTVHKFLQAVGVDKLVGECDGCKERKELLNRLWPYHSGEPRQPASTCEPLSPYGVPFGDVRRNLMMYIYPLREHEVWRWNIEQIRQRLHLFNGKRIVTVMTDDRTNTVQEVQDAFGGERIDVWIVGQNDPNRWEMQGLPRMMECVQSCDPNEITFYCHAKGVRGPEHISGPTFHEQPRVKWATAMYGACLDDMPFVEKQLETHTFAGAFRRRMIHGRRPFRSSWHFAGTFYWFRNARLFSLPNWRMFDHQWYGAETYPGQLVGWGQAAGLFCDRPPELYLQEAWTGQVDAMWERWQQEHGLCTPA